MGMAISIFLIAVGAVLAFAVEVDVSGLDIATVGWILMIVGGLGALFSLVAVATSRRETVVHEDPAQKEVVRERER